MKKLNGKHIIYSMVCAATGFLLVFTACTNNKRKIGVVVDGYVSENKAIFMDGHESNPSKQWILALRDGDNKVFVYVTNNEYAYAIIGSAFEYTHKEIFSIQEGVFESEG